MKCFFWNNFVFFNPNFFGRGWNSLTPLFSFEISWIWFNTFFESVKYLSSLLRYNFNRYFSIGLFSCEITLWIIPIFFTLLLTNLFIKEYEGESNPVQYVEIIKSGFISFILFKTPNQLNGFTVFKILWDFKFVLIFFFEIVFFQEIIILDTII